MVAQAGLCLAWSETPEGKFCRVVDHLNENNTVVSVLLSVLGTCVLEGCENRDNNRVIVYKSGLARCGSN